MSPELIGVFGTGIALAAAFIPFLASIRREGRDAHERIAKSIKALGDGLSARMDRMDQRARESENRTRETIRELDTRMGTRIQESENRTREDIRELDTRMGTRIQESENRTREVIRELDTRMDARIQESENRTREDIRELDTCMDTRIQESEDRTREDIRELRAFIGGDRPATGTTGAG